MASPLAPPTPPTPEGLAYEHAHIRDNVGPVIIGVDVTLTTLATVCVALRLLAGRNMKTTLHVDDYLIIAALLAAWAVVADECVGVHFAVGRHIWAVTPQAAQNYIKGTFVGLPIYLLALLLIRLSILLLYKRVFVVRWFQIVVAAFIVEVVGLAIASILVYIFRCTPVKYGWDRLGHGHCVNFDLLFRLPAIFNFITDALILLLPMPVVWNLHTSVRRKVALTAIFVLGGLSVASRPRRATPEDVRLTTPRASACISALVRLGILMSFNTHNQRDFTWKDAPLDIWAVAEVAIGLCCACFPTMGPLFRGYFQDHITTARDKASSTGDGTGKRKSIAHAHAGFSQLDEESIVKPENPFRPYHPNGSAHKSEITAGEDRLKHDTLPMDAINVKSDVEWSSADTR
ncbi:MAG: hypothetical protein M1826_001757 [Phylliscum demangeonii]|nr:MAG: hypothetical protein M1826_001757 [Phylliscum demangeonii]